MMKDPFYLPVAVDLAQRQELAYALGRLIPAHVLAAGGVGIVCNRASKPMGAIEATTDRNCIACSEAVWVAPSSKRVPKGVFVCLDCIEQTVRGQ